MLIICSHLQAAIDKKMNNNRTRRLILDYCSLSDIATIEGSKILTGLFSLLMDSFNDEIWIVLQKTKNVNPTFFL